MTLDWHIDGRDVNIQEWNTLNEMTVEEAEYRLNSFDELLEALEHCKSTIEGWMEMFPEDVDSRDHYSIELANEAIRKAKDK